TTGQHVATARRSHPFTKTVLFFSLTNLWLVCPLHWYPPLDHFRGRTSKLSVPPLRAIRKPRMNIKIMKPSCQAQETYSHYSQSYPHFQNPVTVRFSSNWRQKIPVKKSS